MEVGEDEPSFVLGVTRCDLIDCFSADCDVLIGCFVGLMCSLKERIKVDDLNRSFIG